MRILFLFIFFLFTSSIFAQDKNSYEQAVEAFDEENWESAISNLSGWIRDHTGDADAYLLRGQAYQQMGDLVKANTDFSIAINLRPEHAESYFIRGRTRYQMELYESSIEDFASFLRLPKGETNQIIFRKSPGESGVSQIMTAQNENPAEAYYHMGLCSFELEYYETAAYYHNLAIENDPRNPNYHSEKGRALGRIGENDLAIEAFEKALEIDPANQLATQGLREVNNGGSEEFLAELDKTVEENYANAQTYKQRGFYRMNHDNIQGAIEDFTDALRLDSGDPETWYYRGRAFSSLENYKSAEEDFSRSLEIDGQNFETYLARGQTRYKKGLLNEAMADFIMVVTLDPSLATGYFHMGITHHRLKQMDLACQNLQKAEEMGMNETSDIIEKICNN